VLESVRCHRDVGHIQVVGLRYRILTLPFLQSFGLSHSCVGAIRGQETKPKDFQKAGAMSSTSQTPDLSTRLQHGARDCVLQHSQMALTPLPRSCSRGWCPTTAWAPPGPSGTRWARSLWFRPSELPSPSSTMWTSVITTCLGDQGMKAPERAR
jgi:hypothetical protein